MLFELIKLCELMGAPFVKAWHRLYHFAMEYSCCRALVLSVPVPQRCNENK